MHKSICPQKSEEGIETLSGGVAGGCQPPDVGAGN